MLSDLAVQAAPPTVFTYQGQLKHQGVPVSGEARFAFTLWDAEVEGREVADPVQARLTIVDGLFTAPLDFGPEAFNGEPRWLEIRVETAEGGGMLTPRQPVTPAPIALFALNGNRGPSGPAGAAGQPGTDGLACWDADGDGVKDLAEDVNNDGEHNTLDCQGSSGSTDLTLPFAGTNITDDNAFEVINVGVGGAATFVTINAANAAAAVSVLTTGTGPGVMAVNSGGGPAIVGATGAAGGNAGFFSVMGDTATQVALRASNDALGTAALIETTNAVATAPTLSVETSSLGVAGEFFITKLDSTADTLAASTNGNGTAIHAYTSGTGRAGYFEVAHLGPRTVPAIEAISNSNQGGAGLFKTTSPINTAAALAAEAAGNATAIKGVAKGAGAAVMGYNAFGGNAVVGMVEGGAGRAGSFRSTDSTNPHPTLEAVRSGSGSAGRFENTSPSGLAGEFVGDVSVAGTLAADSYQHRTPRTHYLSLTPWDFHPSARELSWSRHYGGAGAAASVGSDEGERNYLGAAVHLPQGAVVTSVKAFYYYFAGWSQLEVTLNRRLMWNGGDFVMATMNAPDEASNGVYNMVTSDISNDTIDNQTYGYWVYAGLENVCVAELFGCTPAGVQGVVITYTKDID